MMMSDIGQCIDGEPPKTAKQLAKEAKKKDKLAKFDAKKSKINEKKDDIEVNLSSLLLLSDMLYLKCLSFYKCFTNINQATKEKEVKENVTFVYDKKTASGDKKGFVAMFGMMLLILISLWEETSKNVVIHTLKSN